MKTKKSHTPRPEYFELPAESGGVNEAIIETVRALQRQFINQKMPEDNTLRYTHGRAWSNRSNPEAVDGGFHEHSAEWATPFQDLIDGDLTLIPKFVKHVTEEFQRQFTEMIYSTVEKVTLTTGNVVSAHQPGGFPAAFLEMLRKVEFGVDKKGNVSLPELHTGSDAKKLIEQLQAQPSEFKEEVERIKAEKIEAAHARETERKAKFKSKKSES